MNPCDVVHLRLHGDYLFIYLEMLVWW